MNHINENQDGEDFGNREERLLVEREIAEDEAARIQSEEQDGEDSWAAERINERALEDRGEDDDFRNHADYSGGWVEVQSNFPRYSPSSAPWRKISADGAAALIAAKVAPQATVGLANYTKLRSGEWGIRGTGSAPRIGTRVEVTKKSGDTKTERVGAVVWQGNGIYLAAVLKAGAR